MRDNSITSANRGTLFKISVSRVSRLAIIRGSAAFLAPLMGMVPLRRWPPMMRIRSMTIIPPEAVYGRLRLVLLPEMSQVFRDRAKPFNPLAFPPQARWPNPLRVSVLSGFFQSDRSRLLCEHGPGLSASGDWREAPPPASRGGLPGTPRRALYRLLGLCHFASRASLARALPLWQVPPASGNCRGSPS